MAEQRLAGITRKSTAGLTASLLYTWLSCSLPSGLSRRERQLAGYQDATERLPAAFTALRRACPGGITTYKLRACQLNRCSRRDRPDGEREIFLAVVADQL